MEMIEPLPGAHADSTLDPVVITALEATRTTPVENSMYARLYGCYTRLHWRMIWIAVHRGCVRSRISVVIVRFGGECLVERFGLILVVSLTIVAMKRMYHKK